MSKPANIKSVAIKNQGDYGTCYAHAISRNFVRTLQILGIIKAEYNEQFYLLFLYILTEVIHLDCTSGGGNWTYSFDLLEHINKYINSGSLFTLIIPNTMKCYKGTCTPGRFFLNIIQDEKDRIIRDFKTVYRYLHIAKYIYKVDYENKNINYPSAAIKQLLEWRLQPYIGFDNFETSTISQVYGHAVNLRSWIDLNFEIKNSWGTTWSTDGNRRYSNITQISNKINYTVIFSSLIFDFDNLDQTFKDIITNNIRLFTNRNISNNTISIKTYNFSALPKSIKYGFMNGNGCYYKDSKDIYTGQFSFGVFIEGSHTYITTKLVFTGKFEKEIFKDGEIKHLYDIIRPNEFYQISKGTFTRTRTKYLFTWELFDGIMILKDNYGLIIKKYEKSVAVKYYYESNLSKPLSYGLYKGVIHMGNKSYHAKRDSKYNVMWDCSVKCSAYK